METLIQENNIDLDYEDGKRKQENDLNIKGKVKKVEEEGKFDITMRKKPGRKRLELSEANTKKEKNRVAQRAWRKRKEKYILELESKIAELENSRNTSETEKLQLQLTIEKLRSENMYLKTATSFIFTPSKETQIIMNNNKIKIQKEQIANNTINNLNSINIANPNSLNQANLQTLNALQTQINPNLLNNNISNTLSKENTLTYPSGKSSTSSNAYNITGSPTDETTVVSNTDSIEQKKKNLNQEPTPPMNTNDFGMELLTDTGNNNLIEEINKLIQFNQSNNLSKNLHTNLETTTNVNNATTSTIAIPNILPNQTLLNSSLKGLSSSVPNQSNIYHDMNQNSITTTATNNNENNLTLIQNLSNLNHINLQQLSENNQNTLLNSYLGTNPSATTSITSSSVNHATAGTLLSTVHTMNSPSSNGGINLMEASSNITSAQDDKKNNLLLQNILNENRNGVIIPSVSTNDTTTLADVTNMITSKDSLIIPSDSQQQQQQSNLAYQLNTATAGIMTSTMTSPNNPLLLYQHLNSNDLPFTQPDDTTKNYLSLLNSANLNHLNGLNDNFDINTAANDMSLKNGILNSGVKDQHPTTVEQNNLIHSSEAGVTLDTPHSSFNPENIPYYVWPGLQSVPNMTSSVHIKKEEKEKEDIRMISSSSSSLTQTNKDSINSSTNNNNSNNNILLTSSETTTSPTTTLIATPDSLDHHNQNIDLNGVILPNTYALSNPSTFSEGQNFIPTNNTTTSATTLTSSIINNNNNNGTTLNFNNMQYRNLKPVYDYDYEEDNLLQGDNQPMSDKFFNNMIQMLHQQQQQQQQQQQSSSEEQLDNINGEEDWNNQNNKNRSGSNSSALNTLVFSNNGSESRNDNKLESTSSTTTTTTTTTENTKSTKSTSTLQFPAEQKPTKLSIPYQVFPRVTKETVDKFVNEAKLTEDELENLCSELESKATCKEKIKYLQKNVEVEGWSLEKWQNGRIEKNMNKV